MSQPTVLIDWGRLKDIAEFVLAAAAIITFLSIPFLDRLFIWMFKRNRDSMKSQIDEMYAGTIKSREDYEQEVDRLIMQVNGTIAAQAERDSQMVERFTEMFDRQSETLSAIHTEAQATARSVAHIYGLLEKEPWDGQTERRESERRSGDKS